MAEFDGCTCGMWTKGQEFPGGRGILKKNIHEPQDMAHARKMKTMS